MEDLRFLQTPRAFELRRLHATPPGTPGPDTLRLLDTLRPEVGSASARALVEQIDLERRAHAKFSAIQCEAMLFERVALEQATSSPLANFHASRFPRGARIADVGCGLGADTLAFAECGLSVVGIEPDPVRARLASHNLLACGHRPAIVRGKLGRSALGPGEAESLCLPCAADAVFIDPDRRPDGKRTASLHNSSPALEDLLALAKRGAVLGIKAPPALPDEEIPEGAACEFLGEGGECKEAFLSLGLGLGPGGRFAVLVEEGIRREIRAVAPRPSVDPHEAAFLYDPHPVLRRAGGVDDLAEELDAPRSHPAVSYLFGSRLTATPWARPYRVLQVLPLRERDVVRALREDPPRTLIIKARGFDPDETRWRRVVPRSPEGPTRVLVMFASGRSRTVVVCAPVDDELSLHSPPREGQAPQ